MTQGSYIVDFAVNKYVIQSQEDDAYGLDHDGGYQHILWTMDSDPSAFHKSGIYVSHMMNEDLDWDLTFES
jgi:hypothetical protein